ncbi:JAB domain-containing protein [Emticicia sp. CRIBPO]|uniref:JAB domain-containing protein n=1 Tax=Emticicia sp. CRIBPO TaxID=2683258 RepID=UPI0038D50170
MFRIAVYKLTTKLILVHNHPSGNTNVSDLDKSLTNRLIDNCLFILLPADLQDCCL